MEEGETINAMYNHFNDIIVCLKGLGKVIGKAELNRKLLVSLLKEWHPKVMTIEKTNDLPTMTMEELAGSLITHKHTKQMDKEEAENKKTKKDLILKILMQGEEDNHDEEKALIIRNFKSFLRKKMGGPTSRKNDDEDRGREIKRDLKIKKMEESSKGKIQCYKCKGYGRMMHECPSNKRILILKGRKFSKLLENWMMKEVKIA